MAHKRNTTGLARAAKERREETMKRVDATIKQLIKEKKSINFNSISKAANVGKPWLYKEDAIRQQVEALRKKNFIAGQKIQKDFRDNASSASKDHIIQMLKERIRKLEAEHKKSQEQIEMLYGELYLKREAGK